MEWNCKPVLTMLAVGMALAVMNIMIKKEIQEGMNRLVFITLRHLVATLFMAPIAFFHERAALTQYLFYIGLDYTTATFSCAFLNISPVCTFLLALALRMEVVRTKTKEGVAKALGTIVCFIGVLVLILYKGVALNKSINTSTMGVETEHSSRKWLMGLMALLAGCVSWSAWFPLQLRVSKKYPHLYSCTAIVFFLSFLQDAVLSLATQRGATHVGFEEEAGDCYCNLFMGSGLGFLGMSWCVGQRGPVFTAAFTPLIQIAAAVIDFAFLHEVISLGSVLGSVLVIAGLYSLLWGKNKEVRKACAEAKATNASQVNTDRENQV
ncbi:hypothetical protein ZIOFF_023955 [Zingiber officinale]|uniref:WAT1-related protein n=1 Tax=Zingiber officinale TaxID=94328 RepID=A0A8J5GSU0_ZINOF|nr:hypothetical protein ZIOFF_023955 [Zingiber officinale]